MSRSTWGLGWVLDHIIFVAKQQRTISEHWVVETPPYPAHSCQNCSQPSHQAAKKSTKNGPCYCDFLSNVRDLDVFHRCLTFLLSLRGCNWSLWVLHYCPWGYILPVKVMTFPNQIPNWRFRWAKTSQYLLEICHVAQHLRAWIGTWSSYFYCKAILICFRTLEGRNTAVSCPFMPKLPLPEPPDNNKNAKMVNFVHFEGSWGVPQLINHSNVI